MSTTLENSAQDLPALLETAGARPRGNRHDCPKCGGLRTVTHSAEAFFCHKCQWKGNTVSLAKEFGFYERLPRSEYIRQKGERERAEGAAQAFLVRVRGARFGLDALHIELLNLRDQGTEQLRVNPNNETAWDALAYVYSELPRVRAELALLGEGTIGDRIAWLQADEEKRREMSDRILRVGGVPTFDVKWAEVE